jgi:hypothetical protein
MAPPPPPPPTVVYQISRFMLEGVKEPRARPIVFGSSI